MNSVNNSSSQSRVAPRSSLACLPCRSRHLKCDGKQPQCSRCVEFEKPCHYAPSRRGGLDRAALAERRKRLAASEDHVSSITALASAEFLVSEEQSQELPIPNNHDLPEGIIFGNEAPVLSSGITPDIGMTDIRTDELIDSYYSNFHKFHPFPLPRKHMLRICRSPERRLSYEPLIAAMRLVGYIYANHKWSEVLKEQLEACIARTPATNPVMVQSRLLYSIALFWSSYKEEAKIHMDAATKLALDIQMHRKEFSMDHGMNDLVVAESWRRSWWMLFIVDAYYAGTLGTMNFTVVDVESTVELPCEEAEYESGNIPEPQTLDDFDSREFAAEETEFSSFAYLIGAVRCAALAISTAPKIASKENSAHVIHSADSIIDGWSLLLPKNSKQVMTKTGDIDELMFQAQLLVEVATIGLHRPLSDLKFNPVEDVSTCARDPPPDNPTSELINVHTVRVLRAVESQIRLLALPVRPFHHTPFTTCMISEGTLALLSACHFMLKGKQLAIARDQIRMTIGCLKAVGEVWPRTASNVKEIQIIARHVLGLKKPITNNGNQENSSGVPSLLGGEGQGSLGSETEASGSETDVLATLGSMEDVCGWYSLSDIGPDFTQWMENESSNMR